MKSETISNEIATLQRKASETKNKVAKAALTKKIDRLKVELDKITSSEQAKTALAKAQKKIREMSNKDFNEFVKKLSKKPEFGFLKSMTKDEIRLDVMRTAKPVGWRFRGRNNMKKPTKTDIREGNDVYYEGRRNRSDVSRPIRLAEGGGVDMLQKDDFVWNALGKKLVVDKVTDDEYWLSGFMQPSASPFSKGKVHDYLKKGEWSLKPKMAKGGGVGSDEAVEKLWNGYASAILFSETDSETEEPLDSNYSISDFDTETVSESKKMLRKYYSENKKAIKDSGLDLDTIGMDIWYTRAGHGAGFFDHSLDDSVEKELTNSANKLGEYPTVETYDGKISVRGGRVFANGGGVDAITPALNKKVLDRAQQIYIQEKGKNQKDFETAFDKAIIEFGYKPAQYHKIMSEIGHEYDDSEYAKGGGVEGKSKYRVGDMGEYEYHDTLESAIEDFEDLKGQDITVSIEELKGGNYQTMKKYKFASSEDISYVELTNGKVTVSLQKDEGKWIEGSVLKGKRPENWGSKRYMSYLSADDLCRWLSKDYGGKWEVVEQYAKGGGVKGESYFITFINSEGKKKSVSAGGKDESEAIKSGMKALNLEPLTWSTHDVQYLGKYAKGGGVGNSKKYEIPVIQISDDEKLNFLIGRENPSKEEREKILKQALTTKYEGVYYSSIGYESAGRGASFDLDEAKENANILKKAYPHYDFIIKETIGVMTEKDITKKKYVVMSNRKFTSEELKYIRPFVKYAKGGGVGKAGIKKYKLRAEGIDDFLAFLRTGMYVKMKSFTIEPVGIPDVVVTFETDSSLSEIKQKLREVQDSHVMLETVKPVNEYTGERGAGDDRYAKGGGVGDIYELIAKQSLMKLKESGEISQLTLGNHGQVFMSINGGQVKSYDNYKDAYAHYHKTKNSNGGGVGEMHRSEESGMMAHGGGTKKWYNHKITVEDKFGNVWDVAMFRSKGDALLCLKALQTNQTSNLHYNLIEA